MKDNKDLFVTVQTIAISTEDGSYGAYPISCEEGEMFSESPKKILNESDKTIRIRFYLVTFPLQATTTISDARDMPIHPNTYAN